MHKIKLGIQLYLIRYTQYVNIYCKIKNDKYALLKENRQYTVCPLVIVRCCTFLPSTEDPIPNQFAVDRSPAEIVCKRQDNSDRIVEQCWLYKHRLSYHIYYLICDQSGGFKAVNHDA